MKVAHCLGWYFPESTGGTEIYVQTLVRALKSDGVDTVIGAAIEQKESTVYDYQGISVYRYSVFFEKGEDSLRSFERFLDWLEAGNVTVYHQHSWNSHCGLPQLEAAKRRGFHTILTVHVPNNICLRGTMVKDKNEACDGRVEVQRCGVCWLRSRGMPYLASTLIAKLPEPLTQIAHTKQHLSSVFTALSSKSLVMNKMDEIQRMEMASDKIVAVCQWLIDALKSNGVSDEKLVLSRQGVDHELFNSSVGKKSIRGCFKIGYLGRWHPTKGIDILIDAVKSLPQCLSVELVIYGLVNNEEDQLYRDQLVNTHQGESRINIQPSVSRESIVDVIKNMDLLAIPSQWLESGPLVALEAMAVGTPVIGSKLGGIDELLTEYQYGYLVSSYDKSTCWSQSLLKAIKNEKNVDGIQRSTEYVRTVKDVSKDMTSLYNGFVT